MEHVERLLEKPDCSACKKLKAMYNKEPDCENCIPPLLPGNYDTVRVWVATRDQVRTAGMGGAVYGMDHMAVWTWMEKYKIQNQTVVFEKLNWLFYQLLETSRLNKGHSDA